MSIGIAYMKSNFHFLFMLQVHSSLFLVVSLNIIISVDNYTLRNGTKFSNGKTKIIIESSVYLHAAWVHFSNLMEAGYLVPFPFFSMNFRDRNHKHTVTLILWFIIHS